MKNSWVTVVVCARMNVCGALSTVKLVCVLQLSCIMWRKKRVEGGCCFHAGTRKKDRSTFWCEGKTNVFDININAASFLKKTWNNSNTLWWFQHPRVGVAEKEGQSRSFFHPLPRLLNFTRKGRHWLARVSPKRESVSESKMTKWFLFVFKRKGKNGTYIRFTPPRNVGCQGLRKIKNE